MKDVISKADKDRLDAIAAAGGVLVEQITALEREACALLGLDPDGDEDLVECDHVVDFVWNAYRHRADVTPAPALGEAASGTDRLLANVGVVVE